MPKTILTSLHISFLILFALCTTGELSAQINIELDGENPICFGLASGSITSTVTGGTLPYTYNWSTGDEEPFIQNLPAGEYSLTVTDANGMGGTATITLTEPPIVTLEVSADQNCEAPFTLTADAGGGVGDFIYNWSTGDDTPQIVVSDEIEYCVTVVDGNGCGTFECITPESNPPSVEVVAVDVLCFGDENGSLTATGNGGTPPYTFSWSNGDSGATINNLGPGVVTVTLTDAAGCTATATGTVNEPPLLTSTTTSLQDVCPDESTGSATVMPNGGTPPYSYLWSTGATTQIASNLSAGTFSVTVTDANDCTVVDEVTIIEFDGPEVTIEGGPVICGVGNTVDITAIATGGTGNYQFEWSTNEFTQTITVGPGTYSVTVEDGNGCTDTETITIEEIDVNITLTSTNILCNGDDNGTATVTVTGGDEPYEFDWSNGETTPTITGLAPGTYTVIVTEANGCKATGSVTITEPPALGVSADVTDVLCNGDETGAIDLTVTGGTPPYTFLWSNGAMTEDLDNLPAGSYTGTVTDANGCTISATLMVTEPPALDVSADVTNVLCNGDATGAIDLTVTGGTAPYTFLWSNGAMTEDLMNIPAGSYTGTVTDANGCTISATLTVTEPPALGVSADVTNVLCNGDETGAIDLTVTGGTAPYTLLWSNGAMTEDLMNIPAGSYTGTVTDANGCTISATVTITEPPALGVSADVTNIDCNGDVTGAIDLTVIGGTAPYTFLWSNGAMTEDLMNIPAGSYTGTVTDANGCTISATVTITEPPALGVSADVTNVDCNGDATGAIDLTVTGGTAPYTFLWSNGAMTEDLMNIPAGSYTGTVTDANGCTISATVTITEPPALGVSADVTNVDCNGDATGAIDLTVTGGTAPYTFLWSNGAMTEDLMNIPAGSYTGTVTDANGCTISATVTVTEPPALGVSADVTNVDCNGDATGAIDLTVTGGTPPYTFLWSNGAMTEDLMNIPAGSYTGTVTDANGCTISATVTITEPPALGVSADVTNVDCNGDATGAIDLTVTGGTAPYTFLWSNGAMTEDLMNIPAGSYTGTVTDANGCTISATVTVTESSDLNVSADVTSVDCNGDATGAIDLTVTGGTAPYTFLWSNGAMTEDLMNIPAGSYTGTVTDANGCTISATLTVTEPPALGVSADVTNVDCNGDATGAIDLTVTGGTAPYTFLWSNGAMTEDLMNISTGSYTGTVTDANGCTISATVTVTEPPALGVSADVTNVDCNGDATGAIDLTVTGGTAPYTFLWSNGAMTEDLMNIPAGSYTGTVTDANGCMISATVTITEPPALDVSADVTNVDCNGDATGAIDLTVTGGTAPYTFLWSNGAMTEDLMNIPAGSYTGTVTDSNGCTISATVTVTEPPALGVSADVTNVDCNGDATGAIDITVTGGTAPYTFLWSNGAMTEDLMNIPAGSYTGTVTDANGCTISAILTVTEPSDLTCVVEILQEPTDGDNGSVTVIPTGGTPPYSFEWSTGETTQTIDGLAPGTYTATVTDDNGCTTVCSATLDAFAGIGDFVWEDLDLDGLQDPNEPGIEGVTVNLKNENGVVIATTMTDENGFYSFTGLEPGTYSVQFIPPPGFDYTASDIGNDDTIDSDIIMGMMGMTGEYTLGPNEFNMTVDAGLIQPPNGGIFDPCNCLDNATNDLNGQFADTLIIMAYSGLEWTIIDRTNMFLDDPINDPPAVPQLVPLGTVLAEVPMGNGFSQYRLIFRLIDDITYMVSVQAGEFVLDISNTCTYPDIFFDELPPDELCIFDPAFPLDANSTVPGDLTYFIAGQEVDVLDPSTLPEGTYNLEIRLDPLDDEECEAVLILEFDIVDDCPAKVGDFVFLDMDGDGIQDLGDNGIEGVKVTITSQDGSFMDMQFTDENGMYMFMVDPGTYKITFEQPMGLSASPQDQGGNDAVDSDIDPSMLMTDFFTLGPDEVNLTIDAGFRNPCVDNIDDPGTIGFDQEVCGPGNAPNTLVEVTPATGGVGVINYLWMSNTEDPNQNISFWHPIPNSNSPNFTPGPVQVTTFFTRCVRRDDCPYLESNIITVTVNDDAVAEIDGPALGCEGEEITFSSAASGPGADISWSVTGDGNIIGDSDSENLTVVWGSFGLHSVTLTVTENGCTSTSTITISVVNNPMVCGGNLQANGTVNSVPNRDVTVEWMLPDDGYEMSFVVQRSLDGENFEAVGQVTDPAVVLGQVALYEYNEIAPVAGLNYYRVVAYNTLGESMTSNIVQFQLAEDDGQMARIFPNPTVSGIVHIEMTDTDLPAEDMTIEFISATGKSISNQKLQSGADFFDLQIDGKSAGIYFVRITCGDKVETHRVLVNE